MLIKKIIIAGSIRLLNKGTNRIEWDINSPHQIIMANNGYGKSTLMHEFSLLPAEAKSYTKSGYKEVIAEHNGNTYKAVSNFSGKHVHSFYINDGENINEGGTITVQKMLIEEHVGYTPEIHNLVLGNIKFTDLTANARKEWFAKISEVNVDFGLKVFNKLRVQARNVVGARKHAETQLLKETSNVLNDSELSVMKQEVLDLNTSVSSINKSRDSFIAPITDVQIKELENRVLQYTADINAIPNLPNRIAESEEEFKDICRTSIENTKAIQARLDSLYREQETVNSVIKLMEDDDSHPIEELQGKYNHHSKELEGISTKYDLSAVSPATVELGVSALTTLLDELEDIFKSLPENTDGKIYNSGTYETAKDTLNNLVNRTIKLKSDLDTQVTKLNNLKLHDPVTCPDCNHIWVPGVSEKEVARLEVIVTNMANELEGLNSSVATAQGKLEDIKAYVDLRRKLMTISTHYPMLKHYWNLISNSDEFNNAPLKLISITRIYLTDLKAINRKLVLKKDMELLEAAIAKKIATREKASAIDIATKTTDLENNIYSEMEALKVSKKREDELKLQYGRITKAVSLAQKLRVAIAEYYDAVKLSYSHKREGILKTEVNRLSAEHYSKWTKINELEATTKVIEHMTKDLEGLERQQALYDSLIEALSPTSGIIADTLMGFMNEFKDQMNNVISNVWTTKLEIRECSIKKGDITYLFPVVAESVDHPMTDVFFSSTAERDIFNFSYRLIAMQYMGLHQFPLLIDELGSSFTVTHKRKLYDYLKLLVDSETFSQLIVISHFTDTVDELNRADINVIDASGLLVPDNANKYFSVT